MLTLSRLLYLQKMISSLFFLARICLVICHNASSATASRSRDRPPSIRTCEGTVAKFSVISPWSYSISPSPVSASSRQWQPRTLDFTVECTIILHPHYTHILHGHASYNFVTFQWYSRLHLGTCQMLPSSLLTGMISKCVLISDVKFLLSYWLTRHDYSSHLSKEIIFKHYTLYNDDELWTQRKI